MLVCEEIEQGEEDREGLLHSQEAVEGPFAVELDNGFGACDAHVGYDVLTNVVAFRGAVPEKEPMEESCGLVSWCLRGKNEGDCTDFCG